MTMTATPERRPPSAAASSASWATTRWCRSSILLILLVAVLQILRPGIVNERWIANTVKFAIPLAHARRLPDADHADRRHRPLGRHRRDHGRLHHGDPGACSTTPRSRSLLAFVPAVLIGLANGIGVGVFRVHPLIMTLGTSLIGTGCLQVYQRTVIATGTEVPDGLAWLGTGLTWGVPNALLALRAGRRADHLHPAPHRLRPPALRRRRQRAGHAHLRRPLLAGDPRALRRLGAARRRSPACSTSA